jgi:hypothetical protein
MSNYGKRIQESAKWWKPSPRRVMEFDGSWEIQKQGKTYAVNFYDTTKKLVQHTKGFSLKDAEDVVIAHYRNHSDKSERAMRATIRNVVKGKSLFASQDSDKVSPLRQSQGEMLSDFAFKDRIVSKEKIGNNTLQITLDDGRVITRLHNTDIVTRMPNGDMVLNSGKWRSHTTAQRLRAEGVPLTIKKGEWFVGDVPFTDGMVLDMNYNPKGGAKAVKEHVPAKENKLVVANAGWGETVPDWLRQEVATERTLLGIASNIKKEKKVGDAEATLYLYTASLTAPMSKELNGVYIYLTAKLMKQRGMTNLPDFAEAKLKKGLTADEKKKLDGLKSELYTARGGEIHSPLLDALRELNKKNG